MNGSIPVRYRGISAGPRLATSSRAPARGSGASVGRGTGKAIAVESRKRHVLLAAVERHDLEARTPEEVDEDAGPVGQRSVASRRLWISFFGSMNGIAITTASRRSPATSTSSSVPSSASSIGTMA
jgi:hypothetical protein